MPQSLAVPIPLHALAYVNPTLTSYQIHSRCQKQDVAGTTTRFQLGQFYTIISLKFFYLQFQNKNISKSNPWKTRFLCRDVYWYLKHKGKFPDEYTGAPQSFCPLLLLLAPPRLFSSLNCHQATFPPFTPPPPVSYLFQNLVSRHYTVAVRVATASLPVILYIQWENVKDG